MKAADIKIGEVYELGRSRGSRGVEPLGRKARVIEVGLRVSYGRRADGARVELLDANGERMLKGGSTEPLSPRIVHYSELLDPVTAAAKIDQAKREREARDERYRREAEAEKSAALKLAERFGIDPSDFSIRVTEYGGTLVIREVSLTRSAIEKYLA